MRKLLLLGLVALRLSATVSNNVQFDVATTGNDLNGGGFVFGATGTDFSQQDAPQFSFTDLASTSGSTNPCVVTSASHNFGATDVGNLIHIISGTNFLASWYSIVSAAGNAATLDRACGSAASISGGTWREGGRFATIGGAVTVADSTTVMPGGASATAVIHVKNNANYVLTSSISVGSNTNIAFVCYSATHGDNAGQCTVTTATNSTALFTISSRSYTFDQFIFTNTAATPAVGLQINSGVMIAVRNSSFSGFTQGLNSSASELQLIGVEVKNSTGIGVAGGFMVIYGSWIHNNAGTANVQSSFPHIINSIISNATAIGVQANGGPGVGMCINSDIANNGTDGWAGTGSSFTMINCPIYGNGGFGVRGPSTGLASNVFPINLGETNGYGNNTSGDRTGYTAITGAMNGNAAALGDVSLSANPFTSATNFALNTTAGGGAALAGIAFPGTFPTGATVGTLNAGAVQTSGGGGGGSGHSQGYGGGYTPP